MTDTPGPSHDDSVPEPAPPEFEPPALFPERPLRPLNPLEGTLYLAALPILYLFGSLLSYLPTMGTPLGYVVLVDQIFNLAGIAVLGLAAFGLSPRRHLGLERPPARLVVLVAAFAVANFVIAAVLSSGFNDWLFTPEAVRIQSRSLVESILVVDTPMEKVWLFLAMVVGAPIAEELFFRGLLQNLLTRWWRPATAILGATVVFTAFHFVPLRFSAVFEIALVLAVLYHRTGSLWLSIVFHAMTNATAQGFFYAPQSASESLERGAVFIPAALAWALLGWLLQREVRRTPAAERPELPVAMRWGWFLPRLAGLWAGALIFGLLAIPLAGANALQLQRQGLGKLQALNGEIDKLWETDAAWGEFFAIRSAVRAEVKRGKVPLDAYRDWLRSVRNDLRQTMPGQPILDARAAVKAGEPLPVERAALDRIRAGAVKRFGVKPHPRPLS
jgi:membrane protease YdiL (CAAX protease family)